MTETTFVVGPLANGDASFLKRWRDGSPSVVGFVPPDAYAADQPSTIPVVLRHDKWFNRGRVVYLERSKDTLWCVAEVTAATRDEFAPAYFSGGITAAVARRTGTDDTDVWMGVAGACLNHVALTDNPGSVTINAVSFLDRLTEWPTNLSHRPVAMRAHEWLSHRPYRARWERAAPLPIVEPELEAALATAPAQVPQPTPQARSADDPEYGFTLRPLRRVFSTAIEVR